MTRGFPSKLNPHAVSQALSDYKASMVTRKQAAEELGISETYFTKLARKAGVKKLQPTGENVGAGKQARENSAARSDIRDQAVIDVVYSGMTQTDAAKKYGVSRLAMNRWIAAYNAELRNPTPEDQRPRETDKRNLKSWAFFAVCRIEARMREEA